jgi:hypothetical protein
VNAFLRKLKLSFLAMLCGWIACNIAWWVGAIPSMELTTGLQTFEPRQTALFAILVGLYTLIVILFAWAVIFLPVDGLLNDHSKLRRPTAAALCGFLSAIAIVGTVFSYVAWFEVAHHGLAEGLWRTLDKAALPYALGTCATGTVAAYVRARMDKPKPSATP